MTVHPSSQEAPTLCPEPHSAPDWVARWQQIARRIRVPLGFLAAGLYLLDLWRHPPAMTAIAWSLALVIPGLWLRGFASGYVKKNRELTVTGPYAFTRNPLYLGSSLIAAGFALALLSWPVAAVLTLGFLIIYVPVIAAEERFLRATFPGYNDYCRRVPRLLPCLIPRKASSAPHSVSQSAIQANSPRQGFSLNLYLKHREYNAAIGALLIYLSLLFLGPLLTLLWNETK